MSSVREEVKFNDYISALKKNSSDTMHFNGIKLDYKKVQQIISSIPDNSRVKTFDFTSCNMGDTEISILFHGLKNAKGNSFENIDVSLNKASSNSSYAIGEFIKNSKTIKSINLYSNALNDKDVNRIGACVAQSKSIEYVSIAENKEVTDAGVRPFLTLLRTSSSPFSKIEVYGSGVSKETKDTIEIAVVRKTKLLEKNRKLDELRQKNRIIISQSRNGR